MNEYAHHNKLYEAIAALRTPEECRALFEDLCTIKEVQALSQRLEVAKMLSKNAIYSQIIRETGASSATVSRVARCLNYGAGGYKMILERLNTDGEEG